jgi:hypothetical protein
MDRTRVIINSYSLIMGSHKMPAEQILKGAHTEKNRDDDIKWNPWVLQAGLVSGNASVSGKYF